MADNEYLKLLLEQIDKRIDTLGKKIDDNTDVTNQILTQAQKTNGRVTKSEEDITGLKGSVAGLERKGFKILDISPGLIQLIALGAVILLVTIATLLNVNLGGLLK